MSLFEVFGEMANPGEVGSIHFGAPQYRYQSKRAVYLKFIVAMIMICGIIYCLQSFRLDLTMISISIIGSYFFIAYFVHPTPDTSNLGWLGCLIDNPFRFSDDMNRFLLFLKILLWPGLFILSSAIDFLRLFANPDFIQHTTAIPLEKIENSR